jgi:Cu(I)/Ag(I) efflux system membrane fusion protein
MNEINKDNNQAAGFRWWLAVLQSLLIPLLGIALLFSLFLAVGVLQRQGVLPRLEMNEATMVTAGGTTRYICPMMCVEPTLEPGRCPVCEMELVAAESGPVFIDPAMRRILNIQTVKVTEMEPLWRIRSVGELNFDESKLRTISAYVPGRIEKLYVNFTGMQVQAGQPLAMVYSPELFVAQKEFLLARGNSAALGPGQNSRESLLAGSRQRLIELGMGPQQIDELENSQQPSSRLEILSPMSGTVIERLAVEGQYINLGDPVYRLADLSRVWLMLQLFPRDAALVRVGQPVDAEVDSLPGEIFQGRVAFVSPTLEQRTRTVEVRIEMENQDGKLVVGDFARATIAARLASPATPGFEQRVVVPREAVLLAGGNSVVYLETEPGRFEVQPVTVGPISNRQVLILDGLKVGDKVVTRGNFLIDSQMQLAGNPSLIDPSRAQPKDDEITDEMWEAFDQLAEPDRSLAVAQRLCIVADLPLGSMGVPLKVEVQDVVMFICCEGCRQAILNDPPKYIEKLRK